VCELHAVLTGEAEEVRVVGAQMPSVVERCALEHGLPPTPSCPGGPMAHGGPHMGMHDGHEGGGCAHGGCSHGGCPHGGGHKGSGHGHRWGMQHETVLKIRLAKF
jgi:hypothetical protein